MKYDFNEDMHRQVIKTLTDDLKTEYIPIVNVIFNTPKCCIIKATGTQTLLFKKRVKAAICTKDGYFWFHVGNDVGNDSYCCVVINHGVSEALLPQFPLQGTDTYIMKPLINTRYNRLKGQHES